MASLKWVAAAALIIIVLVVSTVLALAYIGIIPLSSNVHLPGQPTPAPTTAPIATPFSGSIPLTLNVPFFIFNGTQVTAGSNNPLAILLRADKATIIGSSTNGAAITGNLNPADNGVAYLLVSPNTTNVYGTLDTSVVGANSGIVTANNGLDYFQGAYYTMYTLNLGSLQQISTGVTTSVNLYGYQSVGSPTLTSLLNSTAIASSGLSTATVTAYFSGFNSTGYGEGYKITRMQLLIGAASTGGVANTTGQYGEGAVNCTNYDNGMFVVKQVQINFGNSQSMTTTNINWQGVAVGYAEVGSPTTNYLAGTVINQQYNALPVMCGQSDSPSGTMTINLLIQGSAIGTNTLGMAIKIYYISPSGTIGTTSCAVSAS